MYMDEHEKQKTLTTIQYRLDRYKRNREYWTNELANLLLAAHLGGLVQRRLNKIQALLVEQTQKENALLAIRKFVEDGCWLGDED